MYLRNIRRLKDEIIDETVYPFNIPTMQSLEELSFTKPVTFFVGENGSGKSTLLEAIADLSGFHLAGGSRNHLYKVSATEAQLSPFIKLSWMPKNTKGFFLRAESFFHFASHIDELSEEYPQIIDQYGGKSLHKQSHGESFFSLFVNRFTENAIYLLDEPEAALSPQKQMEFLIVMQQLVGNGCQLIIATHSPILLAFPNAQIYSFDETIDEITYEETPHVQLTKYFLNNREAVLKQLLEGE